MNDLVSRYNQFSQTNKSLIRKALDSSTGVGGALIPEHLEKVITNILPRLRPELAMVESNYSAMNIFSFNRLTTLPSANSSMGEGGTTPTSNSTYIRATVPLKIYRRKGAVTNFLQDASKTYIDAMAAEMENHLISHVNDLTTDMLHGNSAANQYAFSGWDKFITTNRFNESLGGTVPTNLDVLDEMIDLNLEKQGAQHRKAFLMSPQMISRFSRNLTNVRVNQEAAQGFSHIEISGGWRLSAYREIPMVPTSQTRPKSTMGTVSISTATTGGAIPDAAHNYFMVSSVTWDGESLASAEADIATTGGGVSTITLSWSAVAGAFYYKIYYATNATGSNGEKLIKIIPAKTYDGVGTPTGNVTGITLATVVADTGVSGTITTAQTNDRPLVQGNNASPPECVYLIDLDLYQGMGNFVYTNTSGSRFNGLVTIEPKARTDDNMPFLIKSYSALVDAFEATSSVRRGVREK